MEALVSILRIISAQLQRLLSETNKKLEKSKAGSHHPGNDEGSSDIRFSPARVVVEDFPAPKGYDETYEKKKRGREKISFHVGWITPIFLIFYTGFSGYQTYLTRCAIKSSEESFKQTLCQMKAQTAAQQTSASDADKTAANIVAQFRSDQRPYIWLAKDHAIGQPQHINNGKNTGHIGVQIMFSNFGKTPAIGVREFSRVVFGIDTSKKIMPIRITDKEGSIVLNGDTPWNVAYSDAVVDDATFNGIVTGRIPFIVLGRFEYGDMYTNPEMKYSSEFCRAGALLTGLPGTDPTAFATVACEGHSFIK